MTLGDLPREVVEGIRTGAISDPPVSQVAALAAAFGVPPSYLLDRGKDPAGFNEEVVNPSPTGSAWRAMVEWPRPSLPLPNSPEYVEGGSTRWGNAGRQ